MYKDFITRNQGLYNLAVKVQGFGVHALWQTLGFWAFSVQGCRVVPPARRSKPSPSSSAAAMHPPGDLGIKSFKVWASALTV